MANPQIIQTLLTTPQIELNNQGKVVTFNLTGSYHVLGRDPGDLPVGLLVPQDWVVIGRCQACLRRVGQDYHIYDGDGKTPSSNRLFLNNKMISPIEGHHLKNGDELKIGQNPKSWVTLTYINLNSVEAGNAPRKRTVTLKNKSVVLGRTPDANLQLDAPTVSRHHATIDTDAQGGYVIRDYSTNGLFVNGEKVSGSEILAPGAVIRIGPYTLVLQGDELVLLDRGNDIRLDAKNLTREVQGKNKQKLRLLNNISLAIEPGQFVALVGGSGAGKSTLMKVLLGVEDTTEGSVYLNGDDLRKYFNIYRNLIGYVPQNDIVHTNLTVREVLYYTAKLRLPPDADLKEVIQKTLQQTELLERQDTLVRSLSGGQLKRVSIGVELLADPKIFFLDEPTSGLDPGLDLKMMLLLRRLADEGRTIILVTHATTNITFCDRLVILGLGGNLCYYGPPNEAMQFFEVNSGNFADIYLKLETQDLVMQEANRFHQSEYQQEYVDNRLIGEENSAQPVTPKQAKGSYFRQLSILIQRYIKLIRRDPIYLVLSLLTAPVGIALVTLIVSHSILNFHATLNLSIDPDQQALRASVARQVLFVITCAGMWAGFASSLQEIVKEAAIYQRERLVNLGLFAYLSSKVFTLAGLAVLQSLLITVVILIGFQFPSKPSFIPAPIPDIVPWGLGTFITTFLTIVTAFSLGLMVSASVNNSSQANSALPILFLPQIIFSGVLFDIGGAGRYTTWLMLSRWSIGAYGSLASVNSLVPPAYKDVLKRPKMFGDPYPSWQTVAINWGILLLHTLIYLSITLWLQKRKDVIKSN